MIFLHFEAIFAAAKGLLTGTLLATFLMLVIGRIFSVHTRRCGLGLGPTLLDRQWRRTQIIFRLIPLRSFVHFYDNRSEDTQGHPKICYDDRPGWIRFLIPFLSSVTPTLLAAFILGWDEARKSFLPLIDFIAGSISPNGKAQDILQGYLAFYEQNGIIKSSALTAFSVRSLSLLPLTPIIGPSFALVSLRKEKQHQGWISVWGKLSSYILVAIAISWTVAAFIFLFS